MLCATTASGKTAAALAPLIERYLPADGENFLAAGRSTANRRRTIATPRVFIDDEHELSRNIVGQRMLGISLLEVAKGATLQLILASHSMDILAKHREKVVTMQEE